MKKWKRRGSPYSACPICGVSWGRHGYGCKPSTLRAIDAANTRAWRNEDNASDKTWYPPPRDYSVRLRDGFRMMKDDCPFNKERGA